MLVSQLFERATPKYQFCGIPEDCTSRPAAAETADDNAATF